MKKHYYFITNYPTYNKHEITKTNFAIFCENYTLQPIYNNLYGIKEQADNYLLIEY